MSKYLFLFRGGYDMTKAAPEFLQTNMAQWPKWMDALAQQGKFLGGEPLEYPGKMLRGKQNKVTDGPYAEGAEVVSGYLMVEAATLEEATELSKGCPILEHGGSVEVRPLLVRGS